MDTRDRQIHDRLRLISGFVKSHPDVPREVIESGLMIELDETIANLDTCTAEQERLFRSDAFKRRDELRNRLVARHIEPIVLMALVNSRSEAFRVSFVAPDLGSRTDTLASKLSGFAGSAEKHAEFFVRLGLRPTFVSELRALALEHDRVAMEAAALESQKIGVATGLETGIEKGRVLIKALSGLLRHHIATHPALKSEWKKVKRLPAHRAVERHPALPAPPVMKALPAPTETEHPDGVPSALAMLQAPSALPALADGQVASLPPDAAATDLAESLNAIRKLFGWMKRNPGA